MWLVPAAGGSPFNFAARKVSTCSEVVHAMPRMGVQHCGNSLPRMSIQCHLRLASLAVCSATEIPSLLGE